MALPPQGVLHEAGADSSPAPGSGSLGAVRPGERPIDFPFLVLVALFVAALVVCNIIAPKWVRLDLGIYTFEISAGILPYPLTFLVTDILSEVYGKRRAHAVVGAGFVASVFTLGVLWLGNQAPALAVSPIDDETYARVFGLAPLAITASMTAYLFAQSVDVQLFHFWKRLTNGRHLWLRNNASTIVSQFADTILVTTLVFAPQLLKHYAPESYSDLTLHDPVAIGFVLGLIGHGWAFKVLCAALDTPLIYAAVWWLGSHPHDDD